jgi:phage terminase large subunit
MPLDDGLIRLPHNNWRPRPYQLKLYRYLENGGKRAVAIWHRRAGKDEVCLHWSAVAAHTRVGVYWHMLPEANQARKAVWDAVNPHTGLRRINEAFPRELRESTRETDMAIRFKCGSLWQLVGSDNYNSLVGSPPIGVVFSEFALADPSAWGYLRPILAENGGWALFITTPRGRNHASTFFEAANQDDTWFAEQLPATETDVFTYEQLEVEHRELLREYGPDDGEARYRQEYLVSFDAGVMGSYYGSQMEAAEKEKRIGRVLHDPVLPVHTAWDLGIGDATAIWLIQLAGQEIRFIDYIENSGVGLDWYTRELDRRPYKWGEHVLPHDAEARELGTGRSRLEVLRSLGFHRVTVIASQKIEDGINAARMLLPRCWFDAEKCARGISALQNYRRSWNESLRTYSDRPLHDWSSHACFHGETMVLTRHGTRQIKDLPCSGEVLTPCGWKQYTNPRLTKRDAPLVAVAFTDGLTVKCTPDHLFLTENGWTSARSLQPGSAILSTLTTSPYFSMADCIASGLAKSIRRAVAANFIAMFGKPPSVLFPPVVTFTTGTGTFTTLDWRTSNAFLPPIISKRPGLAFPAKSALWPGKGRPNGMLLLKGDYGIAGRQNSRKPGLNGSVKPVGAWSAVRNFLRWFGQTAGSIFIAARPARPLRIASVKKLSERSDVWDLTVPDGHCFSLENGAVVHNSDALRYWALANVRNAGSTKPLKYPDLAVV